MSRVEDCAGGSKDWAAVSVLLATDDRDAGNSSAGSESRQNRVSKHHHANIDTPTIDSSALGSTFSLHFGILPGSLFLFSQFLLSMVSCSSSPDLFRPTTPCIGTVVGIGL